MKAGDMKAGDMKVGEVCHIICGDHKTKCAFLYAPSNMNASEYRGKVSLRIDLSVQLKRGETFHGITRGDWTVVNIQDRKKEDQSC